MCSGGNDSETFQPDLLSSRRGDQKDWVGDKDVIHPSKGGLALTRAAQMHGFKNVTKVTCVSMGVGVDGSWPYSQ